MTSTDIFLELEVIQGFVASEERDFKMNEETARELQRLLSELKDKVINN